MSAAGRLVVIKKLKMVEEIEKVTEFINEVVNVSQVNHKNVVYHRDIKSTDKLLDDKYMAQVADFET